MAYLRIDLNGAGVSVGMFHIADQPVSLNFDNFRNYVIVSGLTDYTQWREQFLAVLNAEQSALVTFSEVE
jgi:hypothetical protein